ncbi:MAG: hypothetical protein ACRCV9_16550 [Burkholderiaceae bacterium]
MHTLQFIFKLHDLRAFALRVLAAAIACAVALGALPAWRIAQAWLAPTVQPFTAQFQVPEGVIRVDYVDEKNFRLALDERSETLVREGRVYVVQKRAGMRDTVLLLADQVQRKVDVQHPAPSMQHADGAAQKNWPD